MACNNICKLCKNLILSTAVNFDATTNELIINLPAGTYYNNERYCLVVTGNIPDTTTITSTVVITIDGDATRYPLLDCGCQQVLACNIGTRTKYPTVVKTNSVTGVFKLLSNNYCVNRNLQSLPVTTGGEA
jgi:hypothetical protein